MAAMSGIEAVMVTVSIESMGKYMVLSATRMVDVGIALCLAGVAERAVVIRSDGIHQIPVSLIIAFEHQRVGVGEARYVAVDMPFVVVRARCGADAKCGYRRERKYGFHVFA